MAGGGSRPGERRGGRQKGSQNKVTWARAEEIAQEHQRAKKPLAVEAMEDGMHRYIAQAAQYQRGAEGEDIKQFQHFFDKAMALADKLAPYQTPKLQSTAIDIEPLDLTRLTDAELEKLAEIQQKASVRRGDPSGTSATQH